MSVKALINITDRDKKGKLIEYKIGEIIKLSDDDEKSLIDKGFAEIVKDSNIPIENNNAN